MSRRGPEPSEDWPALDDRPDPGDYLPPIQPLAPAVLATWSPMPPDPFWVPVQRAKGSSEHRLVAPSMPDRRSRDNVAPARLITESEDAK